MEGFMRSTRRERDGERGGGDVDGAVREINKASRCRGENFVLSSLAGTMSAMERGPARGRKAQVLIKLELKITE